MLNAASPIPKFGCPACSENECGSEGATLENNFGCPKCFKPECEGANLENNFGCPKCMPIDECSSDSSSKQDDKAHKEALDSAISALNKVRANAENIKASAEISSTPKLLVGTLTEKNDLKEFKHAKSTTAAQVISSSSET